MARSYDAYTARLRGDLRLGSGSTRVFLPITSMIVLSIVLTVFVNLFRR